MLTKEEITETIAEALRQARRSYIKPFELGSATIIDKDTINLDIVDDDVVRHLRIIVEDLD